MDCWALEYFKLAADGITPATPNGDSGAVPGPSSGATAPATGTTMRETVTSGTINGTDFHGWARANGHSTGVTAEDRASPLGVARANQKRIFGLRQEYARATMPSTATTVTAPRPTAGG